MRNIKIEAKIRLVISLILDFLLLAILFKSITIAFVKDCTNLYFCYMGKKSNALFKRLLPILWNKYFISVISIIVWVCFFDKNDLLSQYQLTKKLKQLRTEEKYYQGEIEKNKSDMNELRTNPASLEKFAREKYLMKKDNEEIFVIVKDSLKQIK